MVHRTRADLINDFQLSILTVLGSPGAATTKQPAS